MTSPLRVLIVEDRPDDAELMAHELPRVGVAPEWRRVETEAEYLAALNSSPDIILADHTLPQFGAPRALELLRARGLDIPLIVVTGSISEEVAVDRIKQGAADYILKDRMARLGPAVSRALEEKKLRDEKRRAEAETQKNLARIRALHEIDTAIASSLDARYVLNILLEKLDLFLPYPSATSVRLLNPETGELEPAACRNMNEETFRSRTPIKPSGIVKAVIDAKAAVASPNVRTDPRVGHQNFFLEDGFVSYLGVPLLFQDTVLGVLGFFTREERLFSDEEIEFLSTLAGQAAIAVHNSQLYEQSRRQAMELEKSNRVKDEFLGVISHELRTPLNVVMGYTSMIKDGLLGAVNAEQESALQKILDQADAQLEMINNVLYAAVLEAQEPPIERREVNPRGLLDQLRSDYASRARNTEPIVSWNCAPDTPSIHTDSGKLRLVLQNLINNALKFTLKGSVTISVRYSPGAREVEFQVADTGTGIPPDQLPFIFEKFRQGDSSQTRPFGGVGMGLYIARKFTEMLAGKITVKSAEGSGATFTVTIPIEPARTPVASPGKIE